MNKYSQIAIKAIEYCDKYDITPVDAWSRASYEVFPNSESSRKKGCPKSVFLGLCENGLIIGILKGNYTKSKMNKEYALKTISLIEQNKNLLYNEKVLWQNVVNCDKKHNSQMNVVIDLIENGYIKL